jgi:hypothetical protein
MQCITMQIGHVIITFIHLRSSDTTAELHSIRGLGIARRFADGEAGRACETHWIGLVIKPLFCVRHNCSFSGSFSLTLSFT